MRGKPGREPEWAKREEFARLLMAGTSVAEASRRAGVNCRTGRRWRDGRTIRLPSGTVREYGPVIAAKPPVSGRYLSEEERLVIGDLSRRGATVRAIAAELGRAPSTVSRELHRNSVQGRSYRPFEAQRRAEARRSRPGRGKLLADPELAGFVQRHLDRRWSPVQISHALRQAFPDDPARHVAAETIYQAIYRTGSCFRRPHTKTMLRSGRRYRRRRLALAYRPRRLVGMVSIDERPDIADRAEAGHWEGDLIVGVGNRSAIATLVERTSRFTILAHLGGRKTADAVRDAVIAAFAQVPPQPRRSLTWDSHTHSAWGSGGSDPTWDRLRALPWICRLGVCLRVARTSRSDGRDLIGALASTVRVLSAVAAGGAFPLDGGRQYKHGKHERGCH